MNTRAVRFWFCASTVMVQKTRAAINTWFKICYHKRESSSVLLLVLSILCSLISRLLSDICSALMYYICIYIPLIFHQLATFNTYNVMFYQTLGIHICLFIASSTQQKITRAQFSHFCKFRFFFSSHSFTHAIAFLFVPICETSDAF